MKPPGAIALRAVDDALLNLGVHEVGGENRGKSVAIYLASVGIHEPAPWCAAFGYYRLQEAAGELRRSWPQGGYPRSGYCPDIKDWAKENGLWIPYQDVVSGKEEPQRGDIVLYYFALKDRVAHYGLAVDFNFTRKTFHDVEGNTSSASKLDREGDGVYLKEHVLAAVGSGGGWVRLPF